MEEESQFCRLCLTTSVVYYSLLKNNGKEMLFSLTGIEITEDEPSTESCTKCWLDLKLAFFIQQCFLKAEKKLKRTAIEQEIMETEIEIKTEELLEYENDDFITENEGDNNDNVENKDNVLDHDNIENNDNLSSNDEGELIYIQAEDNVVDKKPSICSICGQKCEDEMKLYDHINTHYKGPQMCDECSVSFPNIPAYQGHFQTVHPKLYLKTHICGICQLSFKYRSLYDMHLASLHSETAKTGKRKIPVNSSYDADGSYKCTECSKVFTNKKTYDAHIYHHVKKNCPICGAAITTPNLSKHILTHQTEPAICDICGITCKHSESLKWHKYYSHSNRKRRACEICGQEFKKLYDLRVHLRKHTGERNFFCDTCGKGFFTQYRLNIHIRLTHLKERTHICKYCSQAFSKRDAMLTHESMDKPKRGCVCAVKNCLNKSYSCNKSFFRFPADSRRIHTNELPYVCEVCGEGFRQNVTLRSHRKSKHNIIESKHAQCPDCNKMFKDDWALLSHARSVHA